MTETDPLTPEEERALRTRVTRYAGAHRRDIDRLLATLDRDRAESRAALAADTARPGHPESCERCGRGNITWHAPSPLWNAVMRDPATGHDRYGIVCPFCFVELAEAMGFTFAWHLGPHTDVSGLWAAAVLTARPGLDVAWAEAVAADWVAYWKDKNHRYGRDPEAFFGERVLTEFGLRDAYLAARLTEDRP